MYVEACAGSLVQDHSIGLALHPAMATSALQLAGDGKTLVPGKIANLDAWESETTQEEFGQAA